MSYLAQFQTTARGNETLARRFFDSLNQNEIKSFCSEVYSRFFWSQRCPHWYKESKKQVAFLRWAFRKASKKLKTGAARKELSKFGSEIVREHYVSGDSLDFYALKLSDNWQFYYRHTSYDAVWCDNSNLKICTFCEGDVVYHHCPNELVYGQELSAIREWYQEN